MVNKPKQKPYTQKEDDMKKVANFSEKVKGQVRKTVLDRASWGEEIGMSAL